MQRVCKHFLASTLSPRSVRDVFNRETRCLTRNQKVRFSASSASSVSNTGTTLPSAESRLEGITIESSLTEDVAIQNVLDAGEDVIKLTRAFVDIDSTSGNENVMCKAMNAWLQQRDYTISETFFDSPYAIGDPNKRRWNIIAYKGRNMPRIFFNTHLDVVPPWFPSRIDDVNLYGRGACDTKSLSASMLIAVEQLRREHGIDAGVLFVVDEETDHSGMKAVRNFNPDYLIVGEPTRGKVASIQKGMLKMKVKCNGVSAHSGYPHLGRSAVHDILSFLSDIQGYSNWPKLEGLGETTCNVGFIKGGQAANALAEYCETVLMFRLVSAPEVVKGIVNDMCQKYIDMSFEIISENDPVDMSYVKDLLTGFDFSPVSFNTDIPYLNFDGKAILYGHGDICDAHCPREYIALDDLNSLVGRYKEIVLQLHRQLL